jgi:hypothetical protein
MPDCLRRIGPNLRRRPAIRDARERLFASGNCVDTPVSIKIINQHSL